MYNWSDECVSLFMLYHELIFRDQWVQLSDRYTVTEQLIFDYVFI